MELHVIPLDGPVDVAPTLTVRGRRVAGHARDDHDPHAVPVGFSARDDALDHRVSVSCGSGSVDVVVRRRWNSTGAPEDLAGDGWRLRLYRPGGRDDARPGVLVVPGATGITFCSSVRSVSLTTA